MDSRVVDVPRAYDPTFVILSSWKPLFFNRCKISCASRTTREPKTLESNKSDSFLDTLGLTLCGISQDTTLLMSYLSRGFVAIRSHQPRGMVVTLERVQRQAEFFHHLKGLEPYEMLLERPDEAFHTAVAFRFADKGRRAGVTHKRQSQS